MSAKNKCLNVCFIASHRLGYSDYTPDLMEALSKSCKITLLTDSLPSSLKNKNVPYKAYQVWDGSLLSNLRLFKHACRIHSEVFHVRYYYTLFGLPLFLPLLKLLKKQIVIELPEVTSINTINKDYLKHFSLPIKSPLIAKFLLLTLTKFVTAMASKIIVHTFHQKEILNREYKVENGMITVFPLTHPQTSIPKEKAKRKLRVNGLKVILFFGYLAPYKGITYLLDAFSQVHKKFPKSVLIIVGGNHPRIDVDYQKYLEQYVHKLGIHSSVIFMGRVPKEEVALYFSAADIVVLPYIFSAGASGPKDFAFQHKKALVATRTGIFKREIQNKETGILIEPKNEAALINAIELLLTDEKLRKRIEENLKAFPLITSQRFQETANKYFKLYTSVTTDNAYLKTRRRMQNEVER